MEPPSNLPTEEVTKTKPVSGSPTVFNITQYYPKVETAFGSNNFNWIKNLVNIVNQAMYYTSNGQVQFSWMQNNSFNFGIDNVPSVDLKNLMGFAKQIHSTIFTNNGTQDEKQLNADEIGKRIATLKNSSFLSNLSTSNPMGQLQSKLGDNVKALIKDTLIQIR